MYTVSYTARIKKDIKRLIKQGKDIEKLERAINWLLSGNTLPVTLMDHPLKGGYSGYRACHIEPDWILIYMYDRDILVLVAYATGSHSYLFGL